MFKCPPLHKTALPFLPLARGAKIREGGKFHQIHVRPETDVSFTRTAASDSSNGTLPPPDDRHTLFTHSTCALGAT